MPISFETTGSFDKTESWLRRITNTGEIYKSLERYAQMGVRALAEATPSESGRTAASWSYKIERSRGSYSIIWTNDHMVDGTPLAILLQYGHGTGTGGYVSGRDYINPAIAPIFDKIAEEVWRVVKTA